jgi:hypothetical protein
LPCNGAVNSKVTVGNGVTQPVGRLLQQLEYNNRKEGVFCVVREAVKIRPERVKLKILHC